MLTAFFRWLWQIGHRPPATVRTAHTGRRIEINRETICGRRFDGLRVADWPVDLLPSDRWTPASATLVDDGGRRPALVCSYCGSLHPDILMAKLRAGWTLEGSDKPYKWYLEDPAGQRGSKFYTVHLPRAAAENLLAGLGDGTFQHRLYVRPWIPSLASDAPSWLVGIEFHPGYHRG